MTDLPEPTQARIEELKANYKYGRHSGKELAFYKALEFAIDQAAQIVAEGTVSRSVYESAVRGRSDFREAFRRERDVLFRIQALIEDEIAGAEDTLKLDLTPQAQASASGWLNAAKGIKRGTDRLRGPDSNILPNAQLSASQRVVEAAKEWARSATLANTQQAELKLLDALEVLQGENDDR